MGALATTLLKWLMGPLFEFLQTVFGKWFERSQKRADAKLELELAKAKAEANVYEKRATAEIDWDMKMADATDKSWKDEYLTILLTLPLIAAFIPGFSDYVKQGFENLDKYAPDWYVSSVGVVIAAAFAIRKVTDVFDRWATRRSVNTLPVSPQAKKAMEKGEGGLF